MNKKGFTLIELLAVVTIIALISIIAIPNITKNIKDKKNEISEANQKLLAAATDTYIENNKSRYEYSYESNGSTYCIPIQTLIDNGVLEKPFKNINGQEIDYSNQVQATYQAEYNSFNYQIVENCTEIKQYVNRPNLAENMIPVTYDESINKWVKADINSHWYNYSEKKWANALLVREYKSTDTNSKNRYDYEKAPAGTPILDSDILAQFIWIPRFKYQLFDSNQETPINIVFEKQSQPKSTGTQPGQWLTHPAFTYNNQELSGIWIGKYETSNNENNLIIKPNQTSWTNVDYVEANKKIISMTDNENIYGLKNVNTHMLRNSEWGALAYLTNSIYGELNNNSTTNNITGIYNITGNKEFVIQDDQNESSLGYALNETTNWTTDNSYTTTENLYLTRGNNSIFNYNNSKVIDENTTFRITLTNIETQDQNYQKKYTVTFDPNGGTLSETTKEVSYHEPYGNLPTPTREGYTFLGWNGKNLFKKQGNISYPSSLKLNVGYDESTNAYSINGTQQGVGNIVFSSGPLDIEPGTQITLSVFAISGQAYLGSGTGITYAYSIFSQDNSKYIRTIETSKRFLPLCKFTKNMISDSGGINTQVMLQSWRTGTVFDNYKIRIQIEEGDTATEYEPYYITSDTTVVQQQNHTLKAIWQANS